jgi:hypothetical protein
MALRKIIETQGYATIYTDLGAIESGIQPVAFSAYIKVVNITGDKSKLTANVNFKGDTQQFNKQYQIPVSVESGSLNFIAQVYDHLKTLPDFASAVDC